MFVFVFVFVLVFVAEEEGAEEEGKEAMVCSVGRSVALGPEKKCAPNAYRTMDGYTCLFVFVCALALGVCLKMYLESDAYQLKCILSDVDGETYCVRERAQMERAADLLANITTRCKKLVAYCQRTFPEDERVQRLVAKFNPNRISETLPTSEHTAYSENKGEKLAFCVNRQREGTRLIDPNTLMFVAIHELAHIMTVSEGHKQEFWQNFKFLLEQAKAAQVYRPEDYKQRPREYCGMTITDNPYYDM